MFSAINTGLSGLLAFAKGLDVLSNNVSNLNSPGFKASELAFRDLFYRYGFGGGNNGGNPSLQIGQGVETTSSSIRFNAGELRETGNALDAAIDGNGFFILRYNDRYVYTRAGQFELNEDGILVERVTRAPVMGVYGNGGLQTIDVTAMRTNPPQATSEISFVGNLSRGSTTHEIGSLTVYDAVGGSHALRLIFTNNNAVVSGSWLIEIQDQSNTVVANGEIRYQGNGSPLAGFNTMSFTFSPAGAPAMTVLLNFGEPGSFSGSTNFSGGTSSDLRVDRQNGLAAGSLLEISMNEEGILTFKYSNGESATGQQIALAWFNDLQQLTLTGSNLFLNEGDQRAIIGRPQEGVMGRISPKHIELSNVELTAQFTDMVVIQRGFQASSQIISVVNEMAQQVLDLHSRR